MSWQQMQDTFYNCLDFCKVYDRLPYFYITGGDPILHPDFWRLCELMKQNSIPFTILGNPFHLTATKNSRNMRPQAARPTSTRKTTCGRCTNTKPGRSKSPKPWRTV